MLSALGPALSKAQDPFERSYLAWPLLALLIAAMYLFLGIGPVPVEFLLGIALSLVSALSALLAFVGLILVFVFRRELLAEVPACFRRRRLGYI